MTDCTSMPSGFGAPNGPSLTALSVRRPAFGIQSRVDELEAWVTKPCKSRPNGERKSPSAFRAACPQGVCVPLQRPRDEIATWVAHPWALVRVGKGTSVAFLVKGQDRLGAYQARIAVAEKNGDGTLRWKRRYESATTVNQRDLLHVFPRALP